MRKCSNFSQALAGQSKILDRKGLRKLGMQSPANMTSTSTTDKIFRRRQMIRDCTSESFQRWMTAILFNDSWTLP